MDIYKLEVQFIGYERFLETDVRVVRGKTTYVEQIELTYTLLEMEETVVAAGYFREDAQAPVSSFTYTREEIRRAPGASTSGGEFSAFFVRGGGFSAVYGGKLASFLDSISKPSLPATDWRTIT